MQWLFCVGCLTCPLVVLGEEGMWLFNRPPVAAVLKDYGFEITPDCLAHLQKSSVRFGNGASASFVSAQGLVLTNHHVGAGAIERLSTCERDLLKSGYLAKDLGDELACPGLELTVLTGIEDVTSRVNGAVPAGLDHREAVSARRAVISQIEREATGTSGMQCDVISLYRGGLYHLYRYQRFKDVRLVFAPDARAATFGGDPDNFEFPRHCLDFCFFRAYENGEPAKTPHFLRWNLEGAAEGELVFVSGHPGRTNRSVTLAQLESMRDSALPHQLEQSYRTEAVLRAWADRDGENARRAKQSIVGTQNGRKALQARLDGLLDPGFMQRKAEEEGRLRAAFRANPAWREADAAFDRIAETESRSREFSLRERMLEGAQGFGGRMFQTARTLVRVAAEAAKPDGERLPEYQEANRLSLEHGLFAETPVYLDLEEVLMANSLTLLCAKLGATDPLVVRILAGKAPRERATELVAGTTLHRVDARRNLLRGGRAAVAAAQDPMIALACLVEDESRVLREKSDEAAEAIAQAHRRIAEARFALEGDSLYPDASGTLRLSYGVIKGYAGPQEVPAFTTFRSMAKRREQQGGMPPFDLSDEWRKRVDGIAADVPLNFVSTHDITGGNSGSPMVNRRGELVGLVFDGNAPGLVSDFAYSGERGRAVSVHPAAMMAALRAIYQADRIIAELGG